MSRVFLATERGLGRAVVVKVLPPELASDVSAERFRREVLVTARLQHPNILPVLSARADDGLLFYITPFIEGESLGARLHRDGRLSVETARRILSEVADALACAHAAGVVHRDVKPDNVLLAHNHAILADFGVARALEQANVGDRLTGTGLGLGTLGYMAPEQLTGETNVDGRADLYALGVMGYEMLAGSPPFAGGTRQRLLAAHLTETPRPLQEVRPDAPRTLSALVMRLLEKEPDARPSSATEVLAALQSSPLEAHPTSSSSEQRRERRVPLGSRTILLILGAAVVAVGAFLSLRVLAMQDDSATAADSSPEASVAVLPFVDMSADRENEYFADGLTEELISALGKVRELRVAARTSAFSLKGKQLDIRTIGDTLGVGTLVEGSVRMSGGRLRVSARLVRARDGYQFWAEDYDSQLGDVFAVQDSIARSIASALRIKLTPRATGASLVRRATEDTAAHNLYLKGRYFWNMRQRDALFRAVQYFEQATRRDPSYARAYVGLADAYGALGILGYEPPRDVLPKARAAVRTALELDSTLAEAHGTLAHILFAFDWDWSAAIQQFDHALALDPANATSYYRYAILLQDRRRFRDAVASLEKARVLDPLNPLIPGLLGRTYVNARQPDKAIRALREALELNPNHDLALQQLGHAYLSKGMYDEALAAFRRAAELSGARDSAHLAYGYAVAGQPREGQRIVRALVASPKSGYVLPFHLALAYAGLGDSENALEWLERGYAERASFMDGVDVTEAFDTLRQDPRFVALLARMRLTR